MSNTQPSSGSADRVIKPLPDMEAVATVRKMLQKNPRDLLLFDLAVQTGMGMKDLLRLRCRHLYGLKIGDKLPKTDSFTRRISQSTMTRVVYDSFNFYLAAVRPSMDDYLFRSRKGSRPLHLSSVSHLIKKWFNSAGFEGMSGAKSLQKTWSVLIKSKNTDEKEIDPTHNLKPIEAPTAQELVYRELYRNILSGRIAPGETLTAERIAKQMMVSQMPVREAVHRLRAEGFISIMKKRGFVVNELSTHNLEEITKIRLTLESMAARKATQLRTDESMQRLESIHSDLVASIKNYDVDLYLALNREFHHTIYREADMPILIQIIDGLWGRISPYLHLLMRETLAYKTEWTVKNHEGMLVGMKIRNPQKVVKHLKADLSGAAGYLREMFLALR